MKPFDLNEGGEFKPKRNLSERYTKKKISDFHEHSLAHFLIQQHTIGDLRDSADLNNAIYHANQSLALIKDFFSNIEGSNEEKLEFIEKTFIDLTKFSVNEN